MIIGSCGAGKSTLAKRLHKISGIELIHLDKCYWKPNWTRPEKEEWEKKTSKLTQGEQWIIDGNYRSTFDVRALRADTIVWLDFSRFVCCYRIFKRRLKKNRVDELNNCSEVVTLELLIWILWTFPRENRKDLKSRLEELKDEKKIYILKSDKDIGQFMEEQKIFWKNKKLK